MMKVTNKSVSGTGNGVDNDDLSKFIEGLDIYYESLKKIREKLKRDIKSGKKNYRLLNNWHGEYKIDMSNEDYPYELTNGVCVNYMGWKKVQLSVSVPIKYEAPSFQGGKSINDRFCLVLTTGLESVMEEERLPKNVKMEIARQMDDKMQEKFKSIISSTQKNLTTRIKNLRDELKQYQQKVDDMPQNIKSIEEQMEEFEKKYSSYL